jgi:DNA-binding IclR family transcriptional regulator
VSRGLEVLRLVALSSAGLNLTEIATALRLPKTSVLNVLRSLQASDYVASTDGRYTLGGEALSLAAAIAATVSFPSSLLPRLRKLLEATNETVSLGIHSDDGLFLIYLEVLESSQHLRVSLPRGTREPIHASSVGQAALAFMPERLLENLLDQKNWPMVTANTIVKSDLVKKIPSIRKEGLAKNVGGHVEGVMGVGSPVFDREGCLLCAIAAGGPIARLRARQKEIGALVKEAAEDMSRMLGYQGPYPAPRPDFLATPTPAASGRKKALAS